MLMLMLQLSSLAHKFLMLKLMSMSLLCPVRTCWLKHKRITIRLSANQRALILMSTRHFLTKYKHKHKKKAYACAYVAAVLTSYAYVAYACVASEDRALLYSLKTRRFGLLSTCCMSAM